MRPDYRSDSLVNLVRSLVLAHQEAASAQCANPASGVDGDPHRWPYDALAGLPPQELAERPKTVLILVDGLGYNRILASDRAPALRAALRGSARSVFPSTTASAVTSLLTGVAPLQHGLTGWFLWSSAARQIITPLPFVPRFSGSPIGIEAGQLFRFGPWWSRHFVPSYMVMPRHICDSAYSRFHGGDATRVPFAGLPQMFERVLDILNRHGPGACHVHAYWPRFDSVSHSHGTWSQAAERELAAIDRAFGRFIEACPRGAATIVLTADHGFVDASPDSRVSLADHADLAATLRRPLCGEPRVAYCSPRPEALADFCAYVDEHLGYAFERLPAARLLEDDYFGLGEPHPEFADRVGEQVLIARDDYVIGDGLEDNEPVYSLIGFHGGTSEDEMLVPLVVATP